MLIQESEVKNNEQYIASKQLVDYSLEELFDEHAPFLFFTIKKVITSNQQAEETLKQVFLYLYKHLVDFNPKHHSIRIWLMNITRNIAIDNLCNNQRDRDCKANLDCLSIAEKSVFALFYFHPYTTDEIANILHLPLQLVEQHLHAAVTKTTQHITVS